MLQITHFCGVKFSAWKSGSVEFRTNIMSAQTFSNLFITNLPWCCPCSASPEVIIIFSFRRPSVFRLQKLYSHVHSEEDCHHHHQHQYPYQYQHIFFPPSFFLQMIWIIQTGWRLAKRWIHSSNFHFANHLAFLEGQKTNFCKWSGLFGGTRR